MDCEALRNDTTKLEVEQRYVGALNSMLPTTSFNNQVPYYYNIRYRCLGNFNTDGPLTKTSAKVMGIERYINGRLIFSYHVL